MAGRGEGGFFISQRSRRGFQSLKPRRTYTRYSPFVPLVVALGLGFGTSQFEAINNTNQFAHFPVVQMLQGFASVVKGTFDDFDIHP